MVDVVVVGGGIAGVAAAYHLSATHRVVLVESEDHLARHSTGRSAALFFENYGDKSISPLTLASRSFFTAPPDDLVDGPLVTSRGALWIGRPDQEAALTRIAAEARDLGSNVAELDPAEVARRVPVIRPERLLAGLWEPDPLDLDVAGTHQAFLRGFRRRDGVVITSAPVMSLQRQDGRWQIEAGAQTLEAGLVVNAAGAWGDVVASRADIAPVGLQPMRRTAFMVAGSEAYVGWPMVVDADHDFYFKPDGVQLLCSPADETPSEPTDARPDSLDVALAIERINEATTLGIRSVRSEWAGLRTFAPDRAMVIGPDPAEPTFVWLVGQGGTGIQTAPAAGELVATLIRGDALAPDLADVGVDPSLLAADRPSLTHRDKGG